MNTGKGKEENRKDNHRVTMNKIILFNAYMQQNKGKENKRKLEKL